MLWDWGLRENYTLGSSIWTLVRWHYWLVGSDYLKTASNVLKLSSIKPGFPRVFVKLKPIVYRATRIFSPFFFFFKITLSGAAFTFQVSATYVTHRLLSCWEITYHGRGTKNYPEMAWVLYWTVLAYTHTEEIIRHFLNPVKKIKKKGFLSVCVTNLLWGPWPLCCSWSSVMNSDWWKAPLWCCWWNAC